MSVKELCSLHMKELKFIIVCFECLTCCPVFKSFYLYTGYFFTRSTSEKDVL